MGEIKICKLSELKEKGRKLIEVNKNKIVLFYVKEEVHAINAVCPHRGGSLNEGIINEEGEVVCPIHGYSFDLKTGESFMCSAKVKVYDVRLDGDEVYINL